MKPTLDQIQENTRQALKDGKGTPTASSKIILPVIRKAQPLWHAIGGIIDDKDEDEPRWSIHITWLMKLDDVVERMPDRYSNEIKECADINCVAGIFVGTDFVSFYEFEDAALFLLRFR